MIETIILLASLAGLPVPQFTSTLPTPKFNVTLPVPKFIDDPFVEPVKSEDPALSCDPLGRLIRLPGPRNWYVCPQCGSSSDLMFLGNHLRSSHGKTVKEIESVGNRDLHAWHDNLHNLSYKPTQTTAVLSSCEGGACEVGPVRRLFGRWR